MTQSLTATTTLSYCSPSIQAFGERYARRLVGKAAIYAGERLLLWRAAFLLASLEVAIFVQAVSLVIFHFEPNALETWCDLNAFGKERKNKPKDAYQTIEQQETALWQALADVM